MELRYAQIEGVVKDLDEGLDSGRIKDKLQEKYSESVGEDSISKTLDLITFVMAKRQG